MRKQALKIICSAFVICPILYSCAQKEYEKEETTVRVETLTMTESTVTEGRIYSGVIEESSGTALSFKIPGTLSRIAVDEGQFVKKGELIVEVDPSSLQSNLRIAEATLATAQDTYDRMKMLHDASALPDMKWVEVQNALTSAKSAAQIARNSLNDARMYAPASGYISKKDVEAGTT